MFDTAFIMPEQFLNKTGEPVKSYCLIKSDNDYYKVKHSYQEIESLIQPIQIKGFRR
jgi:hypothetical protein